MTEPTLSGSTGKPPGPPDPPFIPGHMGNPSYADCARMAFLIGLYDAIGKPMPPPLAWQIGPYERRIREWVKGEGVRNLDRLVDCMREPPVSPEAADGTATTGPPLPGSSGSTPNP